MLDPKKPSEEEDPYSIYLQNASKKRSSRVSDNPQTICIVGKEYVLRADRPVNDPVILPERNTNPEWEALLDRLDVATEELIAEAIKMMYP